MGIDRTHCTILSLNVCLPCVCARCRDLQDRVAEADARPARGRRDPRRRRARRRAPLRRRLRQEAVLPVAGEPRSCWCGSEK